VRDLQDPLDPGAIRGPGLEPYVSTSREMRERHEMHEPRISLVMHLRC
jgi:hypothetical protein